MASAVAVKPDIASGITSQGKYVFSPTGKAYGFNNNRSADRVLTMLKSGLAQHKENPPAKQELDSSLLETPYGRRPEPTTSILRAYTRIKPVPAGSDPANENVANDHLWIPQSEVASLLATGEFPDSTRYRMARFTFNDNVRGEPDHWKSDEIETAIFDTKLQMEIGGNVIYAVSGRFSMKSKDGSRGLSVQLEGELKVNRESKKIMGSKILAKGSAWGKSTYTPNPPAGTFPIVFAIVEANDLASRETPPQAIVFGNEYFQPKRR